MIAREWHGWTTPENADAYEFFLRETVIPATEAKGIPGYAGVQVLRRTVATNEVEFKTIFYFANLAAVKAFAGEEYETAYIPDGARALLKRFAPQATHYEVAVRVDQARGQMSHLTCDAELRHYISANLREFAIHSGAAGAGKRAAAVALTVVHVAGQPAISGIPFEIGWENQAALLLTRRSARLKKHAGQWALPGGRIDAGESPEETALRELREEVGLTLGPERVIGRLDDYTTRSGYTIKPVVVWGRAGDGFGSEPGRGRIDSPHPHRRIYARGRPHPATDPGKRQSGAADAGRRELDCRTNSGHVVPVPRGVHPGQTDARSPLRATLFCLEVACRPVSQPQTQPLS